MSRIEGRAGGVMLLVATPPGTEHILSQESVGFVADLARRFNDGVDQILEGRTQAQARHDAGDWPNFLEATKPIRQSDWSVGPIPDDLQDRRVEITGPVDRKMIINALNSGANVFMADFEDATSPTWENILVGQVNLRDAVNGTIRYVHPQTNKVYALGERSATLMVRPRGWHLQEKHVCVDGRPVPAALFDFGTFFFHNARALVAKGSGPYFYLPKLQSHLEARLWNDVFLYAQRALGIAAGTIKATVLIETLPAAFEMDEILYELRRHCVGLNCGRWDYIFSYIKTFQNSADHVLPDRGQVTMQQPFMRAYTQLAIRTCHRRGAFAMGGMAAQIPIKTDPKAHRIAMEKVRKDKLQEVTDGHDGTWVAHPDLVPIVKEVFDAHMPTANQIHRLREDVNVSQRDLLERPKGTRTADGLYHNVDVGVRYLEAWLRGQGCVPLGHLMEDTATAEICRGQVWQWTHYRAVLEDGTTVTAQRVREVIAKQAERIRHDVGESRWFSGCFELATRLFAQWVTSGHLTPFLTLPAYDQLTGIHTQKEEQGEPHDVRSTHRI